MHTIQLKIDDIIFEKFMGLLEILPKDKVENAINNISSNSGISLDDAINKVLNS